jgi:AraC family transcriptional regulator
MIVAYQGPKGATMSRQSGGPWKSGTVRHGQVTLLTRAEQSMWRWDRTIDVSHLYLTHEAMVEVAGSVFDQDLCDIDIEDVVSAEDPVLPALLSSLEQELRGGEIGGKLYVEAVRTQIGVHLLRRYAQVVYREPSFGRLSPAQRRRLIAFVDAHIAQPISLEDLAAQIPTHVPRLMRMFRAEFGCPPYAWVLRRRVERAQALLHTRTDWPLKRIAAECGFSDQSHMTRVFRRTLQVTPGGYRKS